MDTPGADFFSLSSGLQVMPENQNFPLNIFFKWSPNISLLDTVEAMCVRVAHACLYWADFSSTLKGVKGYAPGSVMRMSRPRALSWRQNWSSGVTVRLGASPHPVKAPVEPVVISSTMKRGRSIAHEQMGSLISAAVLPGLQRCPWQTD